ncbi:hypothetical protein [Antarcticimicrobium luteum]|uniref:Flagellar FliJ protein n=1 Tax=Antarcticimicrobium luteum TaxID=2547397 RepID=A0A4V3ASE9_9RHOB|nr:hypothetical protein [Antarcticimicrobium luteum]TDK50228.1 hypothetical protein E1832_07415 [Antarcticimicrobium luteum]
MPARRRISALRLIQRIKQHEIDGYAARMTAIRAEQANLHEEIKALQARVESEGHITSPEAAPYLAGFLRAVEARRALLTGQLAALDEKAAGIEAQLMGSYREAKTNDAALDQSLEQLQKHEDRREAAETEEIARNVYLRNRPS